MRITIGLSDEIAQWVRRKASEQNTSVSKLIGSILETQMRLSDGYWPAFRKWKGIGSINGIDAARRLSREEAHARQ
ncbi:MAG TPA: hypothetical protein VK335_17790 [Bryobacteraceae bacterium]|nr:hypothetical protein [Bryobacteraceae bacterium]